MKVSDIKKYLLAGNCTFTLYSSKKELRYTYKINRENNRQWYTCSVLYGSNNETDYRHMGVFSCANMLLMPLHITDSWHFKMLKQFLQFIYNNEELPVTCMFYPSNNCAKCGKKLTTPESIERGFGPKCWAELGGT